MLSGANTYTGTTIINAGTLKLGASNALPNTAVTIGATGTLTSSTLDLNGFSESIGSLTLGRTGTTAGGATANVANTGGGSPVLTLGGALTYNAGDVGFLNGQATISANINTGGAGRTLAVGDGSGAVDLLISGAISGAGNLTKTGAGVLQLSGANTNTGNLVIQDSTVKLGASDVLVDTSSINVGNNTSAAGATFDLNGFSDTIAAVTLGASAPTAVGLTHSIINTGGTGVLQINGALTYNAGAVGFNNGTATISASIDLNGALRNFNINDSDQAAQDVIISGVIQNSTGTAGLTKNNAGMLVLSGANTYNGATTVAAGTLAVNGSLANTSTYVGNGGTLQGSGSIGGSVTVQSGGIIAAGNSIESLTTGALTLQNASIFAYEIDNDAAAGVAGDLTAVTGNLTLDLGNAALLTLGELGSGSLSIGEKLTLISYTGAWNGGLFSYGSTLADDSTISFSGMEWSFNYNDTSAGTNYTSDLTGSSFVTMTAIPEPNVAALLGGLGALALLRRRRIG
jgi:autotransporter-associated beta strand protein